MHTLRNLIDKYFTDIAYYDTRTNYWFIAVEEYNKVRMIYLKIWNLLEVNRKAL